MRRWMRMRSNLLACWYYAVDNEAVKLMAVVWLVEMEGAAQMMVLV